METIVNTLLSIDLTYMFIGMLVVFFSLEQLLETQFTFTQRPQHLLQNFMFLVVFMICNVFWSTVTVSVIEWLNNYRVGLLHYVEASHWLKLVVGVALIDFTNYWFHRAAHLVPVLWRFHRVHHSDTTMDASTNFRSHPIEMMFVLGTSNIVAVALFGLDIASLGLFIIVATPFFYLEHTNLRFPAWLDHTVGLVFTTPNLHKIHHDQDQYYTDSNYADIFILWDRIFGTYKYKPVEQIKFGLEEFDEDRKQTFLYLFKSPFIDIKRVTGTDEPLADSHAIPTLSEAAKEPAEKRWVSFTNTHQELFNQ